MDYHCIFWKIGVGAKSNESKVIEIYSLKYIVQIKDAYWNRKMHRVGQ
jgi:hypothetical protein